MAHRLIFTNNKSANLHGKYIVGSGVGSGISRSSHMALKRKANNMVNGKPCCSVPIEINNCSVPIEINNCPDYIDINSICTIDLDGIYILNKNYTICKYSTLNINSGINFRIPAGLILVNNGTLNNSGIILILGTLNNNGTLNNSVSIIIFGTLNNNIGGNLINNQAMVNEGNVANYNNIINNQSMVNVGNVANYNNIINNQFMFNDGIFHSTIISNPIGPNPTIGVPIIYDL
jgi:hypothetical protein